MNRRLLSPLLLLLAALAHGQERIKDVIYLHEGGAAFTMDVFKPATANGKALMWIVSGGWVSTHDAINPDLAKAYTDQGFTVFEVVHGAQPRYQIPEIVKQLTHAIRFIHANAATYGVDPHSIGVSGGSAGGHLTLMLAGLGDDGDPSAKDPIDQASSRVDAAVAFFPPTDFLNWGADGMTPFKNPLLKIFYPAFGVTDATPEDKKTQIGHDTSPINYIHAGYPPTLLIHGDKDPLVPLQQSKKMDAALEKAGIEHKLMIVPGGVHGGKTSTEGFPVMIAWFQSHLKGSK